MSLLDTYYKLEALKQQREQEQMNQLQTAFQMANFMQKMEEMQRTKALRTDLANVSQYDTVSRPSMALPGNEDVPDPNSMIDSQVKLSTPQLTERYSDVLMKYDPASEITRRQAREDKEYDRSKDPIISMPGLPMPMAASVAGTFAKNTQQDASSLIAKPGKDYTPASLAEYSKTRDPSVLKPIEPKAQKAPAGFRYTAEGDLEATPGGPADNKYQAKYASDKGRVDNLVGTLVDLEVKVKKLKDNPALAKIVGIQGTIPDIPGGKAADARKSLEQIKSRIMIDTLKGMKELSANGAAGFGQLTEKEGTRLEQYITTLENAQSHGAIKDALGEIEKYAQTMSKSLRTTFDATYSDKAHERYGRRQGDVKAEDAMAELRRRGVIP